MFLLALPLLLLVTGTALVEGVMIKVYNSRHAKGGFFFTALVSFFSMAVFVIREAIEIGKDGEGFIFTTPLLLFGLLAGFLYASASLLTYLAFQWGSFAISNLVLSYSLVLSIGYGLVFRHEAATPFTYVGFAVIAVSLFLLRKKAGAEGEKTPISFRWLFAIGYSVLAAGGFSVVTAAQQDYFNNIYNNEFMIVCLGFSALSLLVVGIVRDGRDCFSILKKGAPYATAAGVANGCTNLITLLLVQMGVALSFSSPIRSAFKSVASFLLSVFLFKESFERRQLWGLVLGGIAVLLLNLPWPLWG